MSIESVMPSNHLILCCPLLLLPLIFPSIRVFSSESVLRIRWPSIGVSASASVLPMNIQAWFPLGFRFALFAAQGTLKSLLQHHSSKASILQRSAFFLVPSLTSIHDYWKNHSFPQDIRKAQRAVSSSFVNSQRHPRRSDFFFFFGRGLSFFGGSQRPPANGCSTASCWTASVLTGEDDRWSLYSSILNRKPLRDTQWNVNKPNLIPAWQIEFWYKTFVYLI